MKLRTAKRVPRDVAGAHWPYLDGDGQWIRVFVAVSAAMGALRFYAVIRWRSCPKCKGRRRSIRRMPRRFIGPPPADRCRTCRGRGKTPRRRILDRWVTVHGSREAAAEMTPEGRGGLVVSYQVYLSPVQAAQFRATGTMKVVLGWLRDPRTARQARKRGAGRRPQPFDTRSGTV